MAVLTLYFKDAVPTGATLHRSLQDGGTAPTAATTTTGWNQGTNSTASPYCMQKGGTEVPRSDASWTATAQPNAAPSQTTGDCWRSENTYNGDFANTNWSLVFQGRGVTTASNTGSQRVRVRIWRTTSANGSSAVELTGSTQLSNTVVNTITNSADTAFTVTWTPGGTKTLTNEYLFVQVAFEIIAAAVSIGSDFDFRVGSAAAITTPDFTASGGADTLISQACL